MSLLLLVDLDVYVASPYIMCHWNCSTLVLPNVTFQELLLCKVQSLSCQAQPRVFPLPFYLSTEEALWGFGVAAVWFRSFQHQASDPSPMHSEFCSVEASTYCLHLTQYSFTWQGQSASFSQVWAYALNGITQFARLYQSCCSLNKRHPHLHTLSTFFQVLRQFSLTFNVHMSTHLHGQASVFAVRWEHRDKVLIKSNSVNLSNGCNQLPHCVLSSTANGCSTICYADRYTRTSQEKRISDNENSFLFTPPTFLLWCKWTLDSVFTYSYITSAEISLYMNLFQTGFWLLRFLKMTKINQKMHFMINMGGMYLKKITFVILWCSTGAALLRLWLQPAHPTESLSPQFVWLVQWLWPYVRSS